jgi:protein-tyrosine phosphatase
VTDTSSGRSTLPAPRTPGRYRVGIVCMGNICRSPMAQVVLEAELASAGLDDRVEVVSSGTGGWHVGNPMDRRAAATLTSHGYDASRHRAQQFRPSWFDDCDVVLAMDADNLADLRDAAGDDPEHRRRLVPFRAFDPRADGDLDVPDPYYGADDGFEHVLAIITRTSRVLVGEVERLLDDAP